MITKEAKQRLKILRFWKEFGLEATEKAFGAKRSTLFTWWKIYKDSNYQEKSLNPGKQVRKNNNKRIIHPLILKEIRRLRCEECPNMGKAKVKKNLDNYCKDNDLPIYSESKIGRIIKEKKVYHHRQKIYHDGTVKVIKPSKKKRKPSDLNIKSPGDLIEIDVVVRFIGGLKRYIVTAVDVHSRFAFALCYNRHNSISAKKFFQELEKIFPGKIKAVQSDNGSEFHKYFMQYLQEKKITHYWNYKGKPFKQGHIEKFNRTIQEEFVDYNEEWLDNVDEFNVKLIQWINWYNTKRYHWGLNLMTPVDYLLTNGYRVQYVVN
jgi:transposase InsO family protein